MDPKLSNLDPKLQDAYNRVMTSSGAPPPGPQAQTPQPANPDPALSSLVQSDPALAPMPNPSQGTDPNMPSNNSFPPPAPTPIQPDPVLAPPIIQDVTPPPPPPSPVEPPPMPSPVVTAEPVAPPSPAPAMVEPSPAPTPIEAAPQPASNLPPGSIPGVNATVAFNATNSDKNVGTTPVKKNGMRIMPVIVGLGIMVLLVVYTIVWIVFFNVKIPFLPQA